MCQRQHNVSQEPPSFARSAQWPCSMFYVLGTCQRIRSGFERPFFRLTASGCIDDRTNIACFAVFVRQKIASLSGRRRNSPTGSWTIVMQCKEKASQFQGKAEIDKHLIKRGPFAGSHPKTCFVTRLSETFVVKAEVKKARRRTEVRRDPFSPTTPIHERCSQSQSEEVLG